MSTGLYLHTTRATGTVLTAAIYNSDHQNHITNDNPAMIGALSDNLTEYRGTTDPGGSGSESLAANLAGELQRIRFAISRIVGKTYWYEAPSAVLETVIAAATAISHSPRIGTVASSATPTPDATAHDEYNVTALAVGATFGAPSGAAVEGQKLTIRIKDNGTSRTLAFNAAYRAGSDVTLPTVTVISKTMYLGFIWNGADSKWDLVAKVNNI